MFEKTNVASITDGELVSKKSLHEAMVAMLATNSALYITFFIVFYLPSKLKS
jgi:hypothetical protein